MGKKNTGNEGIGQPRYVAFYVQGVRIYGCFFDDPGDLLTCEDVEIEPADLLGYVITDYEVVGEKLIVFHADWKGKH